MDTYLLMTRVILVSCLVSSELIGKTEALLDSGSDSEEWADGDDNDSMDVDNLKGNISIMLRLPKKNLTFSQIQKLSHCSH